MGVKIIVHGVITGLFPGCYVNVLTVFAFSCFNVATASISLLYPFSAATIASSEKSRMLL
jgi:hypothetical protein